MGFANDWRYTITGDSRHYCSLVHGPFAWVEVSLWGPFFIHTDFYSYF